MPSPEGIGIRGNPELVISFSLQEANSGSCRFTPGQGRTGHDNHLAAMATTHISRIDYAVGWAASSQQTHTGKRFPQAECMTYSTCGIGAQNRQMQRGQHHISRHAAVHTYHVHSLQIVAKHLLPLKNFHKVPFKNNSRSKKIIMR